jgi:heat shock protein HtpX
MYLILLMPLIVFWGILLWFYLLYLNEYNNRFEESFWSVVFTDTIEVFLYTIPFLLLWLVIWILLQKKLIFAFSWAREITRKENPEIYNIVENLAISRWLPNPKVWILEDDSLNAFATWWSKKDSWIVFSRWLLNKLDKKEIEAVAAHEMTHIINEDVKMLVIITVFIWIIWTLWEILLRTWRSSSRSSNSKWWNPLPLFGLILYLISLIILPLISLAISRKREYLADAWSVELTQDRDSMINALKKISVDSRIESIQKDWVAAMCIADPFANKWFMAKIKSFFSTHPNIEDRINSLKNY